jgi:hypothetical protein
MARGLLSSDPSVRSASVDLVSNHTVFRDQEHFRAMLIDDPLPASTYSSFVHEATHHWCSTSPLGTALSLLFLRAGRGVLRWARSGEDSGLSDSLAAYATFQIAITWLRPLHEGLAQFAEYDVRPNLFGPGRLDSPPVVAAMFYLFDIEARANKAQWDDQRRAYYELLDDIDRWRLSPATVDRKAELLLQPIAAESSAYLLGYLTIKQLYRQARRAQPQLEHADAFMILVRKLVFGDYALVGVILDDSRSPLERGLELGRRLHQRLQVIRTALSAQDRSWKQLEELLMPSKEVTELGVLKLVDAEPYAMYPEDQEIAERALWLLPRYAAEVAVDGDEIAGWMPGGELLSILRERRLMWLGDAAARWVPTGPDTGRVLIGDRVFVEDWRLEHADAKSLDELTLDIYADLYGQFRFATVTGADEAFGFVTREAGGEDAMPDLMKFRLARRKTVGLSAMLAEAISSCVATTDYADRLDRFWAEGALELLNRTYLGFAFDFNERATRLVQSRGIAALLDDDPELIRSVAAASLAASAGLTPEALDELRPGAPLTARETVMRARAAWPIAELPLVDIRTDGFLDSAF